MRDTLDLMKRYLTQKVAKWLIKKILIVIAPYALPLLGIFLIWYVIYSTFFYLPNKFAEKTGVLAFFTTGDKQWDLSKDKSLKDKYDQLTDDIGSKDTQKWTPSMYDQALPYKLPWSLLAAIDRLFGDPMLNDKVHRKPDPQGHYKAIQPNFSWRESTVYTTECEDDNCHPVEYKVKLLDSADTYDAQHRMVYKWIEEKDGDSTVKREVLDHVDTTNYDNDHNRLYQLLKQYGFTDKEYKLVEELSASYSHQDNVQRYAGGNMGAMLDPGDGSYNNYWKIKKEAFSAGQRYLTAVDVITLAVKDTGAPESWIMPLVEISGRESTWNPTDANPTSSAYGLFQFLDKTWEGGDGARVSDPYQQALQAVDYIQQRYHGNPIEALVHWDTYQWY